MTVSLSNRLLFKYLSKSVGLWPLLSCEHLKMLVISVKAGEMLRITDRISTREVWAL